MCFVCLVGAFFPFEEEEGFVRVCVSSRVLPCTAVAGWSLQDYPLA